jgi:outer membrane protein assembly factor BamD (BamD/ComL family)
MIRQMLAVLALGLTGAGCASLCPPAAEQQSPAPVPAAAARPAALREGQLLLQEGKYADAANVFRVVEQEHPGTPWAGSAAYATAVAAVLGDHEHQDYVSALREFDRFIERYPLHDRVPEAKAWRQTIRQIMDARRENARLLNNIEKLKALDLQQEEKRRSR